MRLTRAIVKSFLPQRPKTAHKGTFGRVLVVAGSDTMSGAGVLCAKGALQAGAGLVCLALPRTRQEMAAAALPESLTLGLPVKEGVISTSATAVLLRYIEQFEPSVVLIGSGLSKAPFIIPFLKKIQIPMVLDADGLNALARTSHWDQICRRVLVICTPHPAEMKRLIGGEISTLEKVRVQQAKQLSDLTGGVSVLKGFHSVITDGKTTYINPTGGPALAKAGTGDVLGGMIAGLWAQWVAAEGSDKTSALKAAAAGVYLHGLCGELAAQALSERCVLASDVARQLPRAMKKLLRGK